jgi:hypothetical protein
MRLPWLLGKDLVLEPHTIQKGIAFLASADLTRSWTHDFCDPMPIIPKDYFTFGMMSFGLCTITLSTVPMFMPSMWVFYKITNNMDELIKRKKAYITSFKDEKDRKDV